jgi:hypothetical protein
VIHDFLPAMEVGAFETLERTAKLRRFGCEWTHKPTWLASLSSPDVVVEYRCGGGVGKMPRYQLTRSISAM